MIELSNVTVIKQGRKMFDNFNFKIEAGENWVIQGENGSGKTTLLQLLAGALHPFSGRVNHSFIKGTDWDSLYRERQEKIHFIPTHWLQLFLEDVDGTFYQQRYYSLSDAQLPTVRDVLGDAVDRLKSFAISDSFRIEPLLDLPVVRLSNGQLKKVIILRQLARNIPKLLLLDYPFDGLDAESRRDFTAFIDELVIQFGIQIVLVAHGSELPQTINRKLLLRGLEIQSNERINPSAKIPVTEPGSAPAPMIGIDQPVVEMQDLTIAYGGKKIISNLNWRINKGERWALTGRNGSGKTTLFSLIYADHPMAYSQKIYLFGKRRGTGESIWDIKRRINYFGPEQIHFFNPKAFPGSGRDYILGQPHSDSHRLEKIVTYFEADAIVDAQVSHLSSGQLQLLLLINMFLDEKELLLLDEPFQFLDADSHTRVTQYLNDYLNEEVTLVMVTHDEKDVARWTQLRKRI